MYCLYSANRGFSDNWSQGASRHGPLPRVMSQSMTLQKPGSWVVSVAPVATKGSVDAWVLASPCDYVDAWDHVASGDPTNWGVCAATRAIALVIGTMLW